MLNIWFPSFKYLAVLSILLLLSVFLRAKIKFFQKFYIPNSIIAGFLGLLLGSQLLNIKIFSIPQASLKNAIYHLLAITFISLALKKNKGRSNKAALKTSMMFAIGYGIQACIGFALALLIFSKLYTGFVPSNGILVQLGFSNSPTVAHTMAKGWEKIIIETSKKEPKLLEKAVQRYPGWKKIKKEDYGKFLSTETGISYSPDIGLTFGAIGFLIAAIFGIILIHYGSNKGWIYFNTDNKDLRKSIEKGYFIKKNIAPIAGRLTTTSEAIDTLTIHVALITIVYILTFLTIKLILFGLDQLPESISFLARVIVNFHFIIGALIAMLVKKIMTITKIDFLISNDFMERISGLSVDFMVVAAISAISLTIITQYIIPILIISAITTLITLLYIPYLGSRTFTDHKFARIVTIFSIATGSLATGMALLRVMDPEYKTGIANDIMYGSGLVFFFTFPIMALINLPIRALLVGKPYLNYITLFSVFAYTLLILVIWRVSSMIKFYKPFSIWYNMSEK